MFRKIFYCAVFAFGITSSAAQTLRQTLEFANVPTRRFSAAALGSEIVSYAVSNDDPFLLAYYVNDGSGTLRVVKYDYSKRELRRADIGDTNELFKGCLGAALRISQHRDTIYIRMHRGPSGGCVLVFSSLLTPKAALSGWVLGFMGGYAILHRSMMHFNPVQSMHIYVFNAARNRSTELYPYKEDPQRSEFSRLLKPHISERWCRENNAECDPGNFTNDLRNDVIVNEAAKVFGFEAEFDAEGFGLAAEKQFPPRTVAYIFRERSGRWEHREFQGEQLQRLLGGMSFDEVISKKPDLAFQPSGQ